MSREMKRKGNLYGQICSMENLERAATNAAKQKGQRVAVREFLADKEDNLKRLRNALAEHSYKTSAYRSFTVFEPKRREIDALPFYPDQITDHAVVQVIAPVMVPCLTADTYACIPGRGLHKANARIRKALKNDPDGTRYCLLADVRKFYASIDHGVMMRLIERKIKCRETLWLLSEIVNSHAGLPIGRYLSPYLANWYLSGIDHKVKELLRVRYYFRYNDNMLFLASSKEELHRVKEFLVSELSALKLELNPSWQVFPVDKRGIEFTGYVYFRDHVRLRKSIKQRIMKRKTLSVQSFAAYKGWLSWCDGKHLTKKIMKKYKLDKQTEEK